MRKAVFGIAFVIGLAYASLASALPFQVIAIQPIQVCDDAGGNCAPVNLDPAVLNKIFGQADLGIALVNDVKQLARSNFQVVDVVAANQSQLDEARQLLRGTHLAALGLSANSPVLNVFFVNDLRETDLNGELTAVGSSAVGFAFINSNGIIIDQAARIDTLAHEIGHNAGLDHGTLGAGGADNLMTDGSVRSSPATVADINPTGAMLDKLTGAQVTEARNPLFSVNVAKATATTEDCVLAGCDGPRAEFLVRNEPVQGSTDTLSKVTIVYAPGTLGEISNFRPRPLDADGDCGNFLEPIVTSISANGGIVIEIPFTPGCFDPGDALAFVSEFFGPGGVALVPLSFRFEFAGGFSSQGGFDGTGFSTERPTELSFTAPPVTTNIVPLTDIGAVEEPGFVVIEPSTLSLGGSILLLLVASRHKRSRRG